MPDLKEIWKNTTQGLNIYSIYIIYIIYINILKYPNLKKNNYCNLIVKLKEGYYEKNNLINNFGFFINAIY